MLIILIVGIFVTLLAYALVIGYMFAVPILLILVILAFVLFLEKAHKKAHYKSQLTELPAAARFFYDVSPLLKIKFSYDVETRVSQEEHLHKKIRAAAQKHGINPHLQSYDDIYKMGFNAIKKAQKDWLQQQTNAIRFYVFLQEHEGKTEHSHKGIRDYVNDSYTSNENLVHRMNQCGLVHIEPETNQYGVTLVRYLTDQEKVLAIRTYDEGKSAYRKLLHNEYPIYYHEWLMEKECHVPRTLNV